MARMDNAPALANSLWPMAKTGTQVPDAFEARYTAAAQEVQDFNAQGVAKALWAMATTNTRMLDNFETLRTGGCGMWLFLFVGSW